MPTYDFEMVVQHALGETPNPVQHLTFTRGTDDDHPGDAIADAVRKATSVGGVRVVRISATLQETD